MTSPFATFYVDGLLLGVELRKVQEVIRSQQMTRVPLAPAIVAGLINLRGQIVTVIDLRRRLELADRATGLLPIHVVLRREDEAVSLLVDDIGDVIDVEDGAFESPPETLRGIARELTRGVYKLKERLLLVLETDNL